MRGVILREEDIINKVLIDGELGNKPMRVLRIVAKYYLSKGYEKNDVFNILDNCLKNGYDGYTESKWHNSLKALIKSLDDYNEYDLINIDYICISEHEWNAIILLENKILEKLAFILLVYQKINIIKNPKSGGWINQNFSDIFYEANVGYTGKDQPLLIHKLYELGYVSQKKSCDATSIKINYRANEGNSKIIITNFNNVISYYDEYRNGIKYTECEICGARIAQKSKKPKRYCSKCAKKIDNEKRNQRKR